jgi:diacylglycerol kinase family enzyme
VIAVGGDGTAHEVVNGLVQSRQDGLVFGGLLRGTGSDLLRSLPGPKSPGEVPAWLTSGRRRKIDVGLYRGADTRRYFINAADVGIGAEVVRRQEFMPRSLGGATFLLASLISLVRYRSQPVTISLDGARPQATSAWSVALANGGWFGGGMMIAPRARMDDGRLDVVTIGRLARLKAAICLALVYRGLHSRFREVRFQQAKDISIDSPVRLEVETDGELAGFTPGRFEVLPGALEVIDWDR